MEKNTEFSLKNMRKNSLLFLDGVYKNSIYVQKIHVHVGVVPFLHYLYYCSPILANVDARKKRVVGFEVRSRFNRRMSLLRDALMFIARRRNET